MSVHIQAQKNVTKCCTSWLLQETVVWWAESLLVTWGFHPGPQALASRRKRCKDNKKSWRWRKLSAPIHLQTLSPNRSFLTVHDSPEWRWLGCGSDLGSAVGCVPEVPVHSGSWWRSQTDKDAPRLGALAADADTQGGYGAGLAFGTCPKEAQIIFSIIKGERLTNR